MALPLDDEGIDHTVLSEFRTRLLKKGAETRLLDKLLEKFRERGLLKERGRQRTDSTHVLAAVWDLNRLERVGETMRAALNGLATVVPDWLQAIARDEWYDRYAKPFFNMRLPKTEDEREKLAQVIGSDGFELLNAVDNAVKEMSWLTDIPVVKTLKQVWEQ